MIYTVEMGKAYVADPEHREAITQARRECQALPEHLRDSPVIVDIWDAGCWLGNMLTDHGATQDQKSDTLFCHGQRSFGGDTWQVAADYLNEFVKSRKVSDQPGAKLADEVNSKVFG